MDSQIKINILTELLVEQRVTVQMLQRQAETTIAGKDTRIAELEAELAAVKAKKRAARTRRT